MNKEQQTINEMALAICKSRGVAEVDDCSKCGRHTECLYQEIALGLYKADYRKQSEGEWISVDERLPETEGDYLVWNKEQKKIEIRFFYRLPPNYPVESHPEIREYFGNFADYKRITYWMLLPEAPKMKGD